MPISKCQVQHVISVSAKPGRSSRSPTRLQNTRQVQKPQKPRPSKTSWESEHLLSNEFFEKRKTHAEILKSLAFLFPESIHQSPSIVPRMPRSPDSQHLQVTQPIRRSPAHGCVRHQREAEVSSPPLKPLESHGKPAGDDMANWKIGL